MAEKQIYEELEKTESEQEKIKEALRESQAQEILNRGCSGFIQKPFNMKEISQAIRESLDRDQRKYLEIYEPLP